MFWKISLFALALLSLTAPAWASVIYVSGDQTGTWSADTVIVTAEVRVPPGQSLTILPGVDVLFSVYCKLIVDNGATLRAVGTPADSICFDALQDTAHWHGIRFLSASDSSRLEYCHLTNGWASGSFPDNYGGAIYCSNSSPTISHNTLSGNSATNFGYGGAIYCGNNSNSSISGNNISGNSVSSDGGGIYCTGSSLTISGNTIRGNTALSGGGIYCTGSSPTISGNTVSGNWGSNYGGGILCWNSSPIIIGNTINGNTCNSFGGGICCTGSSPTISGNTFSGNSAIGYYGFGGGIYCFDCSSPTIKGNTISGNSGNHLGGGIYYEESSSSSISDNTISDNSSDDNGGGICFVNCSPSIIDNTICGNTAISNGGAIYCQWYSNPTLVNCIIWGNSPPEIYPDSSSNLQARYCDIQDTLWPGTGNINAYPAFVDTLQHDYRLQWGSPCIDTGDPNPIYNDPDGSRADMGAWYYDQSLPVRVLLTPYNQPIQIPASGGSFQYAIQATNIESTTLSVSVWCNATMPSGSTTAPILGPVTISLTSGQTLSRVRTQIVPAGAPAGMYHYNAYAAAVGDTSEDSFTFTKLGAGGWDLGASDWTNAGESFESSPLVGFGESDLPKEFSVSAFPNPFNPTTLIRFELPVAGEVKLEVFDIHGRDVGADLCVRPAGMGAHTGAPLHLEAGIHEFTFDGSHLPSGIYFAKLTAGDYSQVQKLVLMK